MSNRCFLISGCIELSLRQLNGLSEVRVIDGSHADQIDRPAEQLLDCELQSKIGVPAGTATHFKIDHKVDIAAGRVERAVNRGAEHRQSLDAVPAAEFADFGEVIGQKSGQRSHVEIVPLRGVQSYNRVTAANLCLISSS